MNLTHFQKQVRNWRSGQPWADDDLVTTTLGLAEEAGEVCRAVLKQAQGIRGDYDYWQNEIAKELSDLIIKIVDVAERAGIDSEGALCARWLDVSARDFTKFPTDGLTK